MSLMHRRRALMANATAIDIIRGSEIVPEGGNSVTLPIPEDYSFFVWLADNSATASNNYRSMVADVINNRIWTIKGLSTGGSGTLGITRTANTVKISGSNGNTMGLMAPGKTYEYIAWKDV